jgi:hypothetical protein
MQRSFVVPQGGILQDDMLGGFFRNLPGHATIGELSEMTKAFKCWGWSATVLAHSLSSLMVFAAFLGLWALAAYQWLWIPESSVFLLLLSLVWAIAQVFLAVAALTGSFTSAAQAARADDQRLFLLPFVRFGSKRFAESLVLLIEALAIGFLLAKIFAWVNQHSIEAASFLTFHSEKPVSHLIIESCLRVIECLIWIAVASSLLNFSLVMFSTSWQHVRRQLGKVLLSGCFKIPFLTGFLSVIVFVGSAYAIANWRPKLPIGFWDYAQVSVRIGLVLILLAAGWLFWLLSLARLNSPTVRDSLPVPSSDDALFPRKQGFTTTPAP